MSDQRVFAIPISSVVAEDIRAIQEMQDALWEDLRRDLLGERRLGPHRRWRWEKADDGYLDALDPDDLLAEAKRLHVLAQGLALAAEEISPTNDYDVEDLANVLLPRWDVDYVEVVGPGGTVERHETRRHCPHDGDDWHEARRQAMRPRP